MQVDKSVLTHWRMHLSCCAKIVWRFAIFVQFAFHESSGSIECHSVYWLHHFVAFAIALKFFALKDRKFSNLLINFNKFCITFNSLHNNNALKRKRMNKPGIFVDFPLDSCFAFVMMLYMLHMIRPKIDSIAPISSLKLLPNKSHAVVWSIRNAKDNKIWTDNEIYILHSFLISTTDIILDTFRKMCD